MLVSLPRSDTQVELPVQLGGGVVDFGDNLVRVGMRYDPRLGLHGLKKIYEVLKRTKALPSAEEEPEQDPISISPEFLKLEVAVGISPQFRLDFMSEYRSYSESRILNETMLLLFIFSYFPAFIFN